MVDESGQLELRTHLGYPTTSAGNWRRVNASEDTSARLWEAIDKRAEAAAVVGGSPIGRPRLTNSETDMDGDITGILVENARRLLAH